jgi:hypothetical protein
MPSFSFFPERLSRIRSEAGRFFSARDLSADLVRVRSLRESAAARRTFPGLTAADRSTVPRAGEVDRVRLRSRELGV